MLYLHLVLDVLIQPAGTHKSESSRILFAFEQSNETFLRRQKRQKNKKPIQEFHPLKLFFFSLQISIVTLKLSGFKYF